MKGIYMNLTTLKDRIPDVAKDIRVNFGSIVTEQGAPGLSLLQIHGIALASAYAIRNHDLANAIIAEGVVKDAEIQAAKSAAAIMAMNNIYYRFLHLSEDPELSKMPAKLRMTVIGNPGIPKTDFEFYSLAISAIEGCGQCIKAHVAELRKGGHPLETIQSSIRIAAVLNAVNLSLTL